MRIGLQVPSFTYPIGTRYIGETFAQIAERAERAGFYSLWVMDHFFQIPSVGQAEEPMLEGWSALAFAAGHTNRIRLGTLVTGVTYRQPGVLVKTCTTLDVLSQGRAYFGVGAAWNEQEHRGLGVGFPPLKERFERLEELLQLALQMWAGDEAPYTGTYYQLERPLNSPQSIQRPHPPIMIGGGGEQKTLRLVAQYGNACNLFMRLGDDALRHKLDVLRSHCEQVGRDYAEIEKTTLGTARLAAKGGDGTQSAQQIIEQLGKLAEMGIDQAIFNMPNVADLDVLELWREEVIPVAERIPVAGRHVNVPEPARR
jgi:F420-dependent oxidoreductase-like protein